MTLEEVAVAGERIVDKVPNIKRVTWGARVNSSLTGRVHIMAVLTGINSPLYPHHAPLSICSSPNRSCTDISLTYGTLLYNIHLSRYE